MSYSVSTGHQSITTQKYENIFLYGYETMAEATSGLAEYVELYNHERIHERLKYCTPEQIYTGVKTSPSVVIEEKWLKKVA